MRIAEGRPSVTAILKTDSTWMIKISYPFLYIILSPAIIKSNIVHLRILRAPAMTWGLNQSELELAPRQSLTVVQS